MQPNLVAKYNIDLTSAQDATDEKRNLRNSFGLNRSKPSTILLEADTDAVQF